MGRGQGRRRRAAGDRIALRQFGGGAGFIVGAGGGRGVGAGTPRGAAEKEAPLSPREQQLLNQARGPGILVGAGLPAADRFALQALAVRKLIQPVRRTTGGTIYKATGKQP